MSWLDKRATELNRSKKVPAKLIAIYRAAIGKTELCPLPQDCTLDGMVSAILNHEQQGTDHARPCENGQ